MFFPNERKNQRVVALVNLRNSTLCRKKARFFATNQRDIIFSLFFSFFFSLTIHGKRHVSRKCRLFRL